MRGTELGDPCAFPDAIQRLARNPRGGHGPWVECSRRDLNPCQKLERLLSLATRLREREDALTAGPGEKVRGPRPPTPATQGFFPRRGGPPPGKGASRRLRPLSAVSGRNSCKT